MRNLNLFGLWLISFCLFFGIGLWFADEVTPGALGAGMAGASTVTLLIAIFRDRKWKNIKTGNIYEFIGIAKHSETLERLVIYMDANQNIWVRPEDLFYKKFVMESSLDSFD